MLYSPFKRTKDTCLKIIPTNKHQKCLALDALKEVSPVENLLNWNVKEKIEQFEKYLFENSYNNVVVVGHSKYLKRMIKTDEMMRNCDVWSASVKFFTKPNGGADTWEASWSQAMLLHRTELAEAHPIDKLFSFSGLKKLFIGQPRSSGINNSDNSDDQSVKEDDDTEPDPSEPTCRICQVLTE